MSERDVPLTQLRWHCRRGMLELDKVLNEYFDRNAANLNQQELATLARLLDYPDPVLLDWILGRSQPDDPDLQQLVETLRG